MKLLRYLIAFIIMLIINSCSGEGKGDSDNDIGVVAIIQTPLTTSPGTNNEVLTTIGSEG